VTFANPDAHTLPPQLPALGVDPQFIRFTSLTMESDKFICVRADDSVAIFDLENPLLPPVRRPVSADGALMNPATRTMAMKKAVAGASDVLQIYDLAANCVQKRHQMETVVFWRWISATTLGLVTATQVYHWSSVVRTPRVVRGGVGGAGRHRATPVCGCTTRSRHTHARRVMRRL
jgi:clathrin heavy chain